ncbi:hypothetical protein HCG51_27185 [Tolypothrix sp. PCC 7910]|uniref:hypothetical protein n=1 Tax=Tolypothrix sp. PCC 7910 TaxID=2099387 RepID=UPI00142786C3|nr:hypothetical protein [Tolypothrix sp. PCC 7910]QIR40030.1 hypothetical protein HCG51_27185 [Tolypothrix sp. PCC 7910]
MRRINSNHVADTEIILQGNQGDTEIVSEGKALPCPYPFIAFLVSIGINPNSFTTIKHSPPNLKASSMPNAPCPMPQN